MILINFDILATISILSSISGILILYINRIKINRSLAKFFILFGITLVFLYLVNLYFVLGYVPLRTTGHTRLWYSLFLSLVGLILFHRTEIKWLLSFSVLLSGLFLAINMIYPENFDKTLMPALQSIWFVPHVIVYIFAYALLASSAIAALRGLFLAGKKRYDPRILKHADNSVISGFAFLTMGLLFGAMWAKEAWGRFWTWDPKEIWAFITWLFYLIYIHLRFNYRGRTVVLLWILLISFVALLLCWFGISYLSPSRASFHLYGT